jgi:Peptidase inhibitor family I36
MKRVILIGFLATAASLTGVSVASAQRWGREAVPRSGVCFYEDINFGGRYFCSAIGDASSRVPSGMNDRISSLRVLGNADVTLFRDPNFQGQERVIDSNIPDLRRMGFNDRVSSYEVNARRYAGNGNGYGRERNREQVSSSRWRNYSDAQAVVRRSYRAVLGREPDPSGLRSWTEQVLAKDWTERDLEYVLRQSEEYRTLHGDPYSTGRTARRR